MNKSQAKRATRFSDKLRTILEQLEELHTAASDTFDSKSERWQESEAGELAQENLQALEDAVSYLSDAVDSLDGIDTGE